ncbi:MAG: hypothetical protein AB8B57_05865 [Congregibacter sp.]
MTSRAFLLGLLLAVLPLSSFGDLEKPQAISLLGEKLHAPLQVRDTLLKNLTDAKARYSATPNDADAIIWYGRRMAYTGDYRAAIAIYSDGIQKHPGDARMYRHRGHRYISLRMFDEAISDFRKAVDLIDGTQNAIEPDGAPNARNIPVSTTHGNIWYHLGLAYYLQHDFENALWAYKEALNTGKHPDNIVSTTHWIYMIQRRLGRATEAAQALDVVRANFDIIENIAYFKLCLLYKGEVSFDSLQTELSNSSQDAATMYGLANWLFYNGEQARALTMMRQYIGTSDAWPAFGFIAAEADLAQAAR